MFQVIDEASDLNLLTTAELRAAVGVSSGQNDKITALGKRVSSMITSACMVARDGVNPPTLLLERCSDSFRLVCGQSALYLSRKPVVEMISLTVSGSTLTKDVDYEVDAASGKLIRLSGDNETCWAAARTVAIYDAGFEEVPEDLKAIAAQLAGGYWTDDGVDPMEKSIDIPEIIRIDRWVDASANPQMPDDIMNALIAGGYVNRAMVL